MNKLAIDMSIFRIATSNDAAQNSEPFIVIFRVENLHNLFSLKNSLLRKREMLVFHFYDNQSEVEQSGSPHGALPKMGRSLATDSTALQIAVAITVRHLSFYLSFSFRSIIGKCSAQICQIVNKQN